eukprot:5543083-Pyramimonas_sp.AAC.1
MCIRDRLEAPRALHGHGQKAQAIRSDDQRRMADAWDHAKGRADEQMRNSALTIRVVREENRGLRSDLGQCRKARASSGKIRATRQSGTAALPRAESTPTASPAGAGSNEFWVQRRRSRC